MNGVVDESGRVARGVVSALAETPTLLVMVLLNITMIAAAAWFLNGQMVRNATMVSGIIDRCMPAHYAAPPAGAAQP